MEGIIGGNSERPTSVCMHHTTECRERLPQFPIEAGLVCRESCHTAVIRDGATGKESRWGWEGLGRRASIVAFCLRAPLWRLFLRLPWIGGAFGEKGRDSVG